MGKYVLWSLNIAFSFVQRLLSCLLSLLAVILEFAPEVGSSQHEALVFTEALVFIDICRAIFMAGEFAVHDSFL